MALVEKNATKTTKTYQRPSKWIKTQNTLDFFIFSVYSVCSVFILCQAVTSVWWLLSGLTPLEGLCHELELLDDVDALRAMGLALATLDAFAGTAVRLGVQVVVHL